MRYLVCHCPLLALTLFVLALDFVIEPLLLDFLGQAVDEAACADEACNACKQAAIMEAACGPVELVCVVATHPTAHLDNSETEADEKHDEAKDEHEEHGDPAENLLLARHGVWGVVGARLF